MISVSEYNQYITALLENDPKTQPANTTLIQELQEVTEKYSNDSGESYLNEADASSIKDIFIKRSGLTKGKLCYTSQHADALEINNQWITLAQYLCLESGIYTHHYYHLLFPEAINIDDIDYIQTIRFSMQPLAQLYYSTAEKRLLSLESGYACAKANYGRMGFFVYSTKDDGTSKSYWYELTPSEVILLKQTNQRYFDLLQDLKTRPENSDDDKNLSYITIQLLAMMIECSYFSSGDSEKYTAEELNQANTAYYSFIMLYSTTCISESIISEQEKENLMGQIIHNDGRGVLFEHLWMEVVKGALCVAWANKDMASLVWDYMPSYQFSNLGHGKGGRKRKAFVENYSPFKTKQQTLALAFIIIEVLQTDHVNSQALDKLYTQSLLSLAKSVNTIQVTQEQCAMAVKSALEIFSERITSIAKLIEGAKTDSFPYTKEKKSEILIQVSSLSVSRSETIISEKLVDCISSVLMMDRYPDLKFAYRLFSSAYEKIAIGLLVLASLAEAGEIELTLKDYRISLFRLLNSLNTNEIEKVVRDIITVFASKQYSYLKVNDLASKIAILNQFEAIDIIIKTAFKQILACLCEASNYSCAFFVASGSEQSRLALDAVELTITYKREAVIVDRIPKGFLQDIFQYVKDKGFTFSSDSLNRTQNMVLEHSTYDVTDKNNSSFDF